jgi:hypothetical protein
MPAVRNTHTIATLVPVQRCPQRRVDTLTASLSGRDRRELPHSRWPIAAQSVGARERLLPLCSMAGFHGSAGVLSLITIRFPCFDCAIFIDGVCNTLFVFRACSPNLPTIQIVAFTCALRCARLPRPKFVNFSCWSYDDIRKWITQLRKENIREVSIVVVGRCVQVSEQTPVRF